MAVISGYTSLVTAVQDYMARSDLATFVPNFIQNFEERFYRQPRNYGPWMQGTLNVAFTTTATVPTDYLQGRTFYLNGQSQRPLVVSSLEQIYVAYPRSASSGIPKWIARDGLNFVFGPLPSGSFTLNGTYWAKQVLLRNAASDAATHYLIVNAPDMILYGALMEAEAFMKNDARIPLWAQAYSQALQDYRDGQRAAYFSGGSMQTLAC